MKLTVNMFISIDGVVQGPGGFEEDRANDFDRGGWLVPYVDQDFTEITESWFHKTDAFLLGRGTYEMMRSYWTQVTDENNVAGVKLNSLPKYVASNTLTNPDWKNTTVLSGDVLQKVRELKEKPGGELQVHGSAGLARTLTEAGLVDEFRLLVFPVVIGEGKRLFNEGAPASGFTLVESRVTSTGAVYSALTPTPFNIGTAEVVDGK